MNFPDDQRKKAMDTPTDEGKKRYPPDGIYKGRFQNEPCTCTPDCEHPCTGVCGCRACGEAYMDKAPPK
jgi:hypothetical protein